MPPITNQDTYSYAASGKIGTSVNWLILKKNGCFTLVQERDLNSAYLNFFKKTLTPTFNKVITNLIRQKEHLALQLNFEFGNMSEDEYNRQEEAYLVEEEDIPIQKLKQHIDILFALSDVVMDAEEIAEAFNCPVNTAEEALQKLLFEDNTHAGV
jgi:Fic family protein